MMAKQRVDLPLTPKVTMQSEVELGRHSTGKASSGKREKHVVPHYLRASTGSCHDLCKYGRKHALEAKETPSIPKRGGRKPLNRIPEENNGGTMKSVAKLRASVDSKPTKMPKSYNSAFPKTRRQEISASFKVDTSSKPTSMRVETSLLPTFLKVKNNTKSTSLMVKTSSKSLQMMQASSKLSSVKDKETEMSEKNVASLNPDSIAKQTLSSKGFGGQRNRKIMLKKMEASSEVASPIRVSQSSKSSCRRIASTNARMHRGLKIVSHLKNHPKPRKVEAEEHNNEAQEKTLYVIMVESENQTLQSVQNAGQDMELPSSISHFSSQDDQQESEYATSEFEEDSSPGIHEIECIENVKTLEIEEDVKAQKDGIEFCEEKDCQKRLKFKKRALLGENPTVHKAAADKIGAITGQEKVVLRHQDVEGKKQALVLYNNVIEETASKLIEKGKVKALVGAFENIISLQENKSSAHIVSG